MSTAKLPELLKGKSTQHFNKLRLRRLAQNIVPRFVNDMKCFVNVRKLTATIALESTPGIPESPGFCAGTFVAES